MTWGDSLQFLEDMAEEGVMPQALRDRPILDQAEGYYKRAWRTLSDSRRFTYGQPVAIPLSEVLAYCQLFYVESLEERDSLVRMVRVLDNTYLKVTSDKQKKEQEAADKKSGRDVVSGAPEP